MADIVSIVIPVYNVERYLDRCLTSLVKQTYSHLEIVLVDDGSIDNSAKMCDDWAKKDARIRVVHKKNAGAGFARNTGLELVTGDYTMFVDSDDYIDKTTVEKCINTIKEENADLVMFGRCNKRDNGKIEKFPIISEQMVFSAQEEIAGVMAGLFTYQMGVGISVWGKMFKTAKIKKSNIRFYSERDVLSEDALFILEFFSTVSRIAILPENLYYYCQNGESLSRKYKPGHQKRCDAFLRAGIALCEQLQYSIKIRNNLMARYHMYTLSGMKRIILASMSKKEKRKELNAVFRNPVLHGTITKHVIQYESGLSRVFWRVLKLRMYGFCRFLLWCKIK